MSKKQFITLTFGDMAENHVGMEKIGKLRNVGDGFQKEDLENIKKLMEEKGIECELISLTERAKCEFIDDSLNAYILVLKNGVNYFLEKNDPVDPIDPIDPVDQIEMFKEQTKLEYDKKVLMYGRVVNKKARWNLCFDKEHRDPNYEKGMGTIIGFNEVPIMKKFMEKLEILGDKCLDLKVESNYYYDITKTGIGFHGDSERRIVIAARIGYISLPIHYQWYIKSKPIGERIIINLNPGDMYIMSEKAVGTDWKKRNILTLRHSTGCKKFLKEI